MLKFGIISEVLPETGMARVQFPDADGMVSKPLPCSVPKTLNDKYSFPFDVNEHVWCLMDDQLENGVIGGAIYSKNETPGALGNIDKAGINFEQGLHIEYNRETRILSITGDGDFTVNILGNVKLQSAGEVQMIAPAVNITGNVVVSGSVSAGSFGAVTSGGGTGDMVIAGKVTAAGDIESTGGDIKQGAIKLGTHKHTGVQTGGGVSGTPTP